MICFCLSSVPFSQTSALSCSDSGPLHPESLPSISDVEKCKYDHVMTSEKRLQRLLKFPFPSGCSPKQAGLVHGLVWNWPWLYILVSSQTLPTLFSGNPFSPLFPVFPTCLFPGSLVSGWPSVLLCTRSALGPLTKYYLTTLV